MSKIFVFPFQNPSRESACGNTCFHFSFIFRFISFQEEKYGFPKIAGFYFWADRFLVCVFFSVYFRQSRDSGAHMALRERIFVFFIFRFCFSEILVTRWDFCWLFKVFCFWSVFSFLFFLVIEANSRCLTRLLV